jgi:hypothetical protein
VSFDIGVKVGALEVEFKDRHVCVTDATGAQVAMSIDEWAAFVLVGSAVYHDGPFDGDQADAVEAEIRKHLEHVMATTPILASRLEPVLDNLA